MPAVMARVRATINEDAPNYGTDVPATCFGLPGTGGIQASYCNVDLDIVCKAMDNGHLYLDCSGTIDQKVLPGSYPYIFGCRSSDWKWGGNPLTPPSGYVEIKSGTVGVTADGTAGGRGQFEFSINRTDIDMGPLDDWGASIEGDDGFIWFSGTGTYHMDDPLYPDPVRIRVPGFVQLFDYFPFAVRKNGAWKSCNRSGGSATIRKSGSWRNVKNSRQSDSNSKAFKRDGSLWKRTPEIGAE